MSSLYLSLPSLSLSQLSPRATASWDSTVHNTTSLSKITGNNDRVYAVLKVGVVLAHPPDIELVLRKRICLRVYNRMGLGATLMRAFGANVSINLLYMYIYNMIILQFHNEGHSYYMWCDV